MSRRTTDKPRTPSVKTTEMLRIVDRLWHDHTQFEHWSHQRPRTDCYLCRGFLELLGLIGVRERSLDEAFDRK